MSDKPTRTEKPTRLDPEDADLWEKVARTTEPLKKKARERSARRAKDMAPTPRSAAAGASRAAATQPSRHGAENTAPAPAPSRPGAIDRREAKALGSGRTAIGARLDLHGMRQREAHAALNAFLLRAQTRGHRHVLVITGKGTSRVGDTSESFFADTAAEGAGVLRRAVPRWLAEPPLAAIVVGYSPAAPRHGGEGALYVRLRRPEKVSG